MIKTSMVTVALLLSQVSFAGAVNSAECGLLTGNWYHIYVTQKTVINVLNNTDKLNADQLFGAYFANFVQRQTLANVLDTGIRAGSNTAAYTTAKAQVQAGGLDAATGGDKARTVAALNNVKASLQAARDALQRAGERNCGIRDWQN